MNLLGNHFKSHHATPKSCSLVGPNPHIKSDAHFGDWTVKNLIILRTSYPIVRLKIKQLGQLADCCPGNILLNLLPCRESTTSESWEEPCLCEISKLENIPKFFPLETLPWRPYLYYFWPSWRQQFQVINPKLQAVLQKMMLLYKLLLT